MVLSAFGTDVDERTLANQARLEEEGTEIGELEQLAWRCGIVAEIRELPIDELGDVLKSDRFAIAYIDRAVFDLPPAARAKHSLREARIHTVIPVRITATSIVYHDSLPPRVTRKSLRLFRRAYESLGSHCVVCSKPAA